MPNLFGQQGRLRFTLLALLALCPPLVVFVWLLATPAMNHEMRLPLQHFFIVTNIALMAAGVAFLVARAAL